MKDLSKRLDNTFMMTLKPGQFKGTFKVNSFFEKFIIFDNFILKLLK